MKKIPQSDYERADKLSRLAMLRRLYHHLCNGGTTTVMDEMRVREPITKEGLFCQIAKLEREVADIDEDAELNRIVDARKYEESVAVDLKDL